MPSFTMRAFTMIFFLGAPGMTGMMKHDPNLSSAQGAKKQNQAEPAFDKFLESFTEPCQIQESKPITVNDAQFVVVAQTNWVSPRPDNFFRLVAPVELQLRITNKGNAPLLFPTDGTFGVKILDSKGKQVTHRGEGASAVVAAPILLPQGASYSICRRAEIQFDEKAKAAQLVYHDGTGVRTVLGPFPPGSYRFAFWYSVASERQKDKGASALRSWTGEAVTNEVAIQVAEGNTRGFVNEDKEAGPFAGPIRIKESRALVVNEARFAVVAQANWALKKQTKAVPVELQVLISNLSGRSKLYPTFDAMAVGLIDQEGKRIPTRGGRSATILSRPVSVPPGMSYAINTGRSPLGPWAELRWDPKAKTHDLWHHDGTGWVSIIGPLAPGRYKLVFRYGAAPREERNDGLNAAAWSGQVLIDGPTVEITESQ